MEQVYYTLNSEGQTRKGPSLSFRLLTSCIRVPPAGDTKSKTGESREGRPSLAGVWGAPQIPIEGGWVGKATSGRGTVAGPDVRQPLCRRHKMRHNVTKQLKRCHLAPVVNRVGAYGRTPALRLPIVIMYRGVSEGCPTNAPSTAGGWKMLLRRWKIARCNPG